MVRNRIWQGLAGAAKQYAALFRPSGTKAFVSAGVVSRLTTAMVSFGLLLALSGHGGGYTVAAAASAVLLLANGLALPWFGRLYDRRGQYWVLIRTAPAFGVLMLLLMAAIAAGAPAWLLVVISAAVGVPMPVAGPLVRARWTALFQDMPLLRTAYGFESATIEVVYIIGPILVAALVTGIGRMAGLAAVVICGVGGSLALAVQRGTQPVPSGDQADGQAGGRVGRRGMGVLRLPELRTLFAARFCVGAVFGAVPVATVAFATVHHGRAESGLLLGLWGLTSMISGLAYGALRERTSLYRRLVATLVLFAAGALPLLAIRGMLSLAGALLLAGLTMAPVTVSAMEVLQRVVPAAILTETISWDATVLAFGMAVGTVIDGAVAGDVPASLSYATPVGFGFLALLIVLAGGSKIRDACAATARPVVTPAG